MNASIRREVYLLAKVLKALNACPQGFPIRRVRSVAKELRLGSRPHAFFVLSPGSTNAERGSDSDRIQHSMRRAAVVLVRRVAATP